MYRWLHELVYLSIRHRCGLSANKIPDKVAGHYKYSVSGFYIVLDIRVRIFCNLTELLIEIDLFCPRLV